MVLGEERAVNEVGFFLGSADVAERGEGPRKVLYGEDATRREESDGSVVRAYRGDWCVGLTL